MLCRLVRLPVSSKNSTCPRLSPPAISAAKDLYDYGLSTSWMNFYPPLRGLKVFLDTTAATGALATTNSTMTVMVKNAMENAAQIGQLTHEYTDAAKDTSGESKSCGPFIDPHADQHDLPSRLKPDAPYTVPAPEHPHDGPPATPYGSPEQAGVCAPKLAVN